MPTKKKTTKAPAKTKRKAPAKRVTQKTEKKPPAGLCVNCMPIGQTQIIAMLLVSVFALVSVLATATYKLQVQQDMIDAQQMELGR